METEKAIENLKMKISITKEQIKNGELFLYAEEESKEIRAIETVLKELEEHQKQYIEGEIISAKQGKFFEKMIKENYIHKNKIKEKIKELENEYEQYEEMTPCARRYDGIQKIDLQINTLQELLEV